MQKTIENEDKITFDLGRKQVPNHKAFAVEKSLHNVSAKLLGKFLQCVSVMQQLRIVGMAHSGIRLVQSHGNWHEKISTILQDHVYLQDNSSIIEILGLE